MKRCICLLMVLALFANLGCGAFAEAAVDTAPAHQIEMKAYPFFLSTSDKLWKEDYPLYFLDGAEDLPYTDVRDWVEAMNYVFPECSPESYNDFKWTVEVQEAENKVVVSRDEIFTMTFDFNEGMIYWTDFVAFFQKSDGNYLDITGVPTTDKEGQPYLLSVVNSRNRYGEITALKLKDYLIDMVAQDGKYLVPMQTLSDFCLTTISFNAYFNGQGIYMTSIGSMVDPNTSFMMDLILGGIMTQEEVIDIIQNGEGTMEERSALLMERITSTEKGAKFLEKFQEDAAKSLYTPYMSAPKAKRSDALVAYGYRELCLMLDSFYGLKESHNISSFNYLFLETGLENGLADPDATKADNAIADMVSTWLDDGHSLFNGVSYLAESSPESSPGFSSMVRQSQGNYAIAARKQYPEASEHYYEVGNTAYVTFDNFTISTDDDEDDVADYYGLAEKGELPDDTIGIIAKAHQQITRENSPVKNVVLDLSCNSGGAAVTAAFTLGWFLGDAQVSVRNTFTNSESTMIYRADVNLDHEFDEKDTLAGRGLNLYCLTSPSSFSCGNLVPWAFKADGRVTLLGKVTGGGACVVFNRASAWGTSFQISGPMRLSFVKNGSYYDVDRGVDPDHIIDSYDHFYNRELLTDYINSLY